VGRADEAEVTLVDEVGERHALVLVLLRHRDDEAEVAADQLVERLGVTDTDALREPDLLLLRDQRVLADLAEILVQRSLVERWTAPARTDLHWTHAIRPLGELRLEFLWNLTRGIRGAQWTCASLSSPRDSNHNSTVSIWARCSRPEKST
jgi:hypothetical protein